MIKKAMQCKTKLALSSILMSAALLSSSFSPVYGAEELFTEGNAYAWESPGDLFVPGESTSSGKIVREFKSYSEEESVINIFGNKRPSYKEIVASLPGKLTVCLDSVTRETVPVKWNCKEEYDGTGFEYHFTPEISNSEYTISDSASLPVFTVILDLDGPVQAVFASANETAVFNFLKTKMGLNSAAACGVLANIQHESSFDPHALGDYGTSYGICQWHNERWDRLKDYCKSKKLDSTTLNGQLYYLYYELSNFYPSVLSKLKSVPNTAQGAYDAAYYWCYNFEVPADTANTSATRGNSAKTNFWPIYGDGTTSAPSTGNSISNATISLSATSYVYDGTAKAPSVTVQYGSKTLTKNTDYTVSYSNNTYVGTAYVTITGKGNYSGSVKKAFKIALSAPTLSRPSVVSGGIKVSWGSVKGAASYSLYRRSSGTSWKKITTTSSLSYVDTTIASGTVYAYTVRAVSGGNEGFYNSKGVTAAYLQAPVLNGAANTASGITIKWTSVYGAQGYAIYRKYSGGSYSLIAKVGSGTTSYHDTGVSASNGTIYSYVVRAYKGSVLSAYKAKGFIRLTSPVIYSASCPAKSSLAFRWYQNNAASGYQICYMNTATKVKRTSMIKGGSNTSCRVNAIPKGYYKVCVRAYKTINGRNYTSSWSAVKTIAVS